MLNSKYLHVQIRGREIAFLGCISGSRPNAREGQGQVFSKLSRVVGCLCDSEDHIAEGVSRNGWNNDSITRKKSVTSHRSDFEGKHVGWCVFFNLQF